MKAAHGRTARCQDGGGRPGGNAHRALNQSVGLANVNSDTIGIIGKKECLANLVPSPENENPGALAGATGAEVITYSFKTEHYRKRSIAAMALCHAIADCHPSDACEIMGAALADLRAPMPSVPFLNQMEEARVWAMYADRAQLKAFCAATFEAMASVDRKAFLRYAGRAAA